MKMLPFESVENAGAFAPTGSILYERAKRTITLNIKVYYISVFAGEE